MNGSSCCFRAMKGLAKQYMAGRPGVHVEVEFSTTCGGLMDLAKRGCDGAIIALPLNRFGKMGWRRAFPDGNQPVAEYLLAQTAVGIVVHKSNFVASIRIPQVRDVWAGKIGTWDRLGGAKGRINVYSMEPSRNMGGEILSDQVLDYRKWTKSRKNLLFSERVIASVAADPMGIGVVVLKHELPQRVKVLAVAQDANSAPVAATVENIVREKYPLVRKYKIVFAKEPSQEARDFCEFACGEKAEEAFKRWGLFPVIIRHRAYATERLAAMRAGKGVRIAAVGVAAGKAVMGDLAVEYVKARKVVQLRYGSVPELSAVGYFVGASELLLLDGPPGQGPAPPEAHRRRSRPWARLWKPRPPRR